MADICMCDGGDCPQRDSCYRHKAPPNPYRQSYFTDVPLTADGKCDFYMEVWKKNENHRTEL